MNRIGTTYGGLTGKTKADFGRGKAQYVTFLNVIENTRIDPSQHESVDVGASEKQNLVLRGDLLFNGTSETPEDVALAGVVVHDIPRLYLNSFCFGFRIASPHLCDAEFVAYVFRSPQGRQLVSALAQGATRYNVSKRQFLALSLALPPVPEQRAIAEALSDVDGLLAALDALIAKKRAIKQAAMQQLLTGETRLPGFDAARSPNRLGDVGHCIRGVSYEPSADLAPHDTASTVRLLRANNVYGELINIDELQFVQAHKVSEKQLMQVDDILVCTASGSKDVVGKAAQFRIDDGHAYTFGAFMVCFRVDRGEANPRFIHYLFHTGRYRAHLAVTLAGSSINNLKPGDIESCEFGMPVRTEQDAIATVLSDMDAEVAALEARRDKTRAIKLGMMQQLLTGRIRLVEPTKTLEASA